MEIKNSLYENRKEAFEKAVRVAKREWANIGVSLELCGDIGKFDERDFMIGVIEEDVIIREPVISPSKSVSGYAPSFYPMYLVRNLLRMDEELSKRGYKTVEALYTYIELATKAAERLGLVGTFSMGFGTGYGNVRSGWIGEKGRKEEREIFSDMFFKRSAPSLLKGGPDYDWDFHWNSVREKLKQIFDKFIAWQNDQGLYKKEVKPKARVKAMMV